MILHSFRLLVGASLLVAEAAHAADADPAFSLRLASGVGFPAGRRDAERKLDDLYGVLIPIQVEGGYFLAPRWFLGLRAQAGFLTIAGDACNTPLSCSATDFRIGVAAEYRFDVSGTFRKWLSFGAGYEIARIGVSSGGVAASRVDSGPEYLCIGAGGDLPVGEGFGLGPFVAATLGEFKTAQLTQGDGSERTYVVDPSKLHEWFLLGIRGTWTP